MSDLAMSGDDSHHFFLADGIPISTIAQGLIAAAFIGAIDFEVLARRSRR